MENGFIAKPCNFQGVPGYMLENKGFIEPRKSYN